MTVRTRAIDLRISWLFGKENACQPKAASILPLSNLRRAAGRGRVRVRIDVHLGELAARGHDLLDAKLAQLRLELTQLLGELVLVLGPQLARLDLGSRLLT